MSDRIQRVLATVLLWLHVQVLWVAIRLMGVQAVRENLEIGPLVSWWLSHVAIINSLVASVALVTLISSLVYNQKRLLYLLQAALGVIWLFSFVFLFVPVVSLGTSI